MIKIGSVCRYIPNKDMERYGYIHLTDNNDLALKGKEVVITWITETMARARFTDDTRELEDREFSFPLSCLKFKGVTSWNKPKDYNED